MAIRSTVSNLEGAVEAAEESIASLQSEVDTVESVRNHLVEALEADASGDGGRSGPTFPEEVRSGQRFPSDDEAGPPDDQSGEDSSDEEE